MSPRDHRYDARVHARALTLGASLALLAPAVARAEPVTLTAPAECGSAADVETHTAAYLDRPVAIEDGLHADVAITKQGEEYVAALAIVVRGVESSRELRAPTCPALIDAVGFALAMSVTDARDAAPEGTPAAEAEAADDRRAASVAPFTATPIVAPATPRWGFGLAIAGEVRGGSLPQTAPGASIALDVRRDRIGIEAAVVATWPTDQYLSELNAGVDVDLLAGRLRGCGATGALRFCGGGEVGRMRGDGIDVADGRTRSARWSAVSAGLAWARRITGPVRVFAEVDLLLGIERPRFTLDDGSLLYQPALFSGYLAGGLRVDYSP